MTSGKDKKILLVEDNKMHQFMYSFQFEQAGFKNVRVVATGREGLDAVRAEKPDLILLDLVLEGDHGMGGMEVLKELKSDGGIKDIPVVVLSNKRAKDVAEEAKNLGAADFLLKADYVPREVVSYVENFLNK